MKKITKMFQFLLLISISVVQANFVDNYLTWLQKSDFGAYKPHMALASGILGFGYLLYRDRQKDQQIAQLKRQITQQSKHSTTAVSLPKDISELPNQVEAINATIKKFETKVNTFKTTTDSQQRFIRAMQSVKNTISTKTYAAAFAHLECEDSMFDAIANTVINLGIIVDGLDKNQTKISQEINYLKNAHSLEEMNYSHFNTFVENQLSNDLKKQLTKFDETTKTPHAKSLHILRQALKRMDHVAMQVNALENPLNQQKT